MAIFNSYVKLPEGKAINVFVWGTCGRGSRANPFQVTSISDVTPENATKTEEYTRPGKR